VGEIQFSTLDKNLISVDQLIDCLKVVETSLVVVVMPVALVDIEHCFSTAGQILSH